MFVIPRRALGLLVLVSLFAGANAFALTVNDSTDTHHTNTGECALTGSGTCGLYDVFTYANAHPAGQLLLVGDELLVKLRLGGAELLQVL